MDSDKRTSERPSYVVLVFADHPGGCYICRYFGRRMGGSTVHCAKPGGEHVRSQAERGCAFWQREPGAEG